MINYLVGGLMMLASFSSAIMSPSELQGYRHQLKGANGYITSNGRHINIMLPLNVLYQGKTLYFAENAKDIAKTLESLIEKSDGKVHLQGLLNKNVENLSFQTSAVYAQVSHLSEYLLANTTDVSYAPIVVNSYEKNRNYGIWKIYPSEEVFLNLSLMVD